MHHRPADASRGGEAAAEGTYGERTVRVAKIEWIEEWAKVKIGRSPRGRSRSAPRELEIRTGKGAESVGRGNLSICIR